jgi:hypothetical protein
MLLGMKEAIVVFQDYFLQCKIAAYVRSVCNHQEANKLKMLRGEMKKVEKSEERLVNVKKGTN